MAFFKFLNDSVFSNFWSFKISVGVEFISNSFTPSIRSFKIKASNSVLEKHFSSSRGFPNNFITEDKFELSSSIVDPLAHFFWLKYKILYMNLEIFIFSLRKILYNSIYVIYIEIFY